MLYKTLFEMQKELADLHAKVEELTREKIQGQTPYAQTPQPVPVAQRWLYSYRTIVPVHVPSAKRTAIEDTVGEIIPNEPEYIEEQPTTLEDTEKRPSKRHYYVITENGKKQPKN